MPGLLDINTALGTPLIKSSTKKLKYESACLKYMDISETLETNFLIKHSFSRSVLRVISVSSCQYCEFIFLNLCQLLDENLFFMYMINIH